MTPSRRWRRRLALALLALLVLAGAFGGWLYLDARSLVTQLHEGKKRPVVAAAKRVLKTAPPVPLTTQVRKAGLVVRKPPRPVERQTLKGARTILLLGSDHRIGEPDRGRTDTMLLLRIVPAQHAVSILSIPRDLRVPIPGFGHDRVNMAYDDGGEQLLIATLRNYLGVPIDHFVEVDFRGFDRVVDTLGGVYLPIDQRYYNRNVGTAATNYADVDLQPGYQLLRGSAALSYVRFRHTDDDFYRAARQQLFLREAGRQIVAEKYDFLRMRSLLHDFAAATASDIDSLSELWHLADALRSTPADRMTRLAIPATQEVLYGADYVVDDPTTRAATIARWYHPEWQVRTQAAAARAATRRARPGSAPPATPLLDDGGRGAALVAPLAPHLERCAPTRLPPGYWYPADAARGYVLHRRPAVALYATAGSGRSLLWMETSWQHPPILDRPTRTVTVAGRRLDLYLLSGRLHQVAFRVGRTRVWLTNTLLDELSATQMIELAAGCRALTPPGAP